MCFINLNLFLKNRLTLKNLIKYIPLLVYLIHILSIIRNLLYNLIYHWFGSYLILNRNLFLIKLEFIWPSTIYGQSFVKCIMKNFIGSRAYIFIYALLLVSLVSYISYYGIEYFLVKKPMISSFLDKTSRNEIYDDQIFKK